MSDVMALEKQLNNAKKLVENRELALKLSEIPEFRKLILEEFCVNECARYAQLSAEPGLSPVERADALALAQAAGHLRRFLSVTIQQGFVASNSMQDLEDEIEAARQEEGAE